MHSNVKYGTFIARVGPPLLSIHLRAEVYYPPTVLKYLIPAPCAVSSPISAHRRPEQHTS